jgi:site-specific recombinase XerD
LVGIRAEADELREEGARDEHVDRRQPPAILRLEEMAHFIDTAVSLCRRALLMALYGKGMRRAELTCLEVSDIDSQRMMIRVDGGAAAARRLANRERGKASVEK